MLYVVPFLINLPPAEISLWMEILSSAVLLLITAQTVNVTSWRVLAPVQRPSSTMLADASTAKLTVRTAQMQTLVPLVTAAPPLHYWKTETV